MARIRTVKPEFWTSEAVAEWSIGSRLTFIGLMNYVDDNGVGLANERLITSSLYPMDDPTEASSRVRRALDECSRGGQLVVYEAAGRRLLAFNAWSEHQKIDRPSRCRYPRPEDGPFEPLTSANGVPVDHSDTPHRALDEPSTSPRSARASGTGNREQGTRDQGGESEGSASRKRSAGDRGTRLPDDWWPTDADRTWLRDNHPELLDRAKPLTDEFRDYWWSRAGKDARRTDWSKTWRNRMRDRAGVTARKSGTGRPTTSDHVSATAALAQRYREQEQQDQATVHQLPERRTS